MHIIHLMHYIKQRSRFYIRSQDLKYYYIDDLICYVYRSYSE